MTDTIATRLRAAPVVPLISEDDTERAVATANALGTGGLRVIEVVMRSPGASPHTGPVGGGCWPGSPGVSPWMLRP